MKKALENLKKEVSNFKKVETVSDKQWDEVKDNIIVALMAGGKGERFQTVTKDAKVNKNSYKLPTGDTMIELAVKMYVEAGITNFVALVFHAGSFIEELLGDGSKYGAKITYSYDPEKPVGKGGAVLNALLNGSIPRDKHLIVSNPDDIIVNYEGSFPKDIFSGHLEGVSKGKVCTVVSVEGKPLPYTGMKVVENEITQIEMYPEIPIPLHIGVTLFSPDAYDYFEKTFDLTKKSDFEKVLFPIFAEENKLYATSIPSDNWLAVNNQKAYNQLVEHLS